MPTSEFKNELLKILNANNAPFPEASLEPLDWLFKVLDGEPWILAKEKGTFESKEGLAENAAQRNELKNLIRAATSFAPMEVIIFGEPLSTWTRHALKESPNQLINFKDYQQREKYTKQLLITTGIFHFERDVNRIKAGRAFDYLERQIRESLLNDLAEVIKKLLASASRDSYQIGGFYNNNDCYPLHLSIYDNLQDSIIQYLCSLIFHKISGLPAKKQLMTAWSQYLFVGYRLYDPYALVVICG